VAAASVDCYCGVTLSFVTILNVGSGAAPDNNCFTCVGGRVRRESEFSQFSPPRARRVSAFGLLWGSEGSSRANLLLGYAPPDSFPILHERAMLTLKTCRCGLESSNTVAIYARAY